MRISDDGKWLIIETKHTEKVLDMVPTSKVYSDDLSSEVHVPYTFNNTRILHMKGVNVDGFEYALNNYTPPLVKGVYPFMPHQIDTFAKLTTWGKAFCLNEPRTMKGQPYSEPVLTPEGWSDMGSLEVGKHVIGDDGKAKEILGVYELGEQEVYEITFRDGRKVRCNRDHLWKVRKRCHGGRYDNLVVDVNAMLEGYGYEERHDGSQYADGKDRIITRKMYSVEVCDPVEYRHIDLPIDPYTLGVWLGDGTSKKFNIGFELNNNFDIAKLSFVGDDMLSKYNCSRESGSSTYGLKGTETFKELTKLGLKGCRSWEKFIPEMYLRASVDQRKALLQGLMDTDGHSNTYTTVSERLCNDFYDLTTGLGNTVSVSSRIHSYPYKGRTLQGRLAYEVRIKSTKYNYLTDIKSLGYVEKQRCIKVEGSLYLTTDHVVTHNTSSAIAGIDFLRSTGQLKDALVICPLSTIYSVWVDEIEGMLPDASIGVLHSPKHTNRAKGDFVAALLREGRDFFIINPNGLKNPYIREHLIKHRQNNGIPCIVADESTEFGNQTTKNWKSLNAVKEKAPWLWLMTGTPGQPMTAHGQIRLINPDRVPRSRETWKMMTMVQVGKSGFKWQPKTGSQDTLYEAMRPAIRYRRADVFNDAKPELVFDCHVPPTAKQQKITDVMVRDNIAILKDAQTEHTVVASNAGVLMQKLLQISCGNLKDETNTIEFDIEDKIENLIRIINEAEGKTIIVANYIDTIKRLNIELSKYFKCAMVYGSTSALKRGQIFKDFMHSKNPQVLIAHPIPLRFGIEAASASTLVFFGAPTVAPLTFKQVKDRIYSSHQKALAPAVICLYSTQLEKQVFQNLDAGQKWETGVIDMFLKEIKE